MNFPYLSFITFTPLIGAVLIAITPIIRGYTQWVKWVALFVTTLPLMVAGKLYLLFNSKNYALQFVEGPWEWIPDYAIQYFMGIDGLAMSLVILTSLVGIIVIIASWDIKQNPKGYFSLLLVTQSGLTGFFCSLDFFLCFIFLILSLFPLYGLIGLWGKPHGESVATKSLLFLFSGSILLLLVIITLYSFTEPHTFNMVSLTQQDVHKSLLGESWFRYLCWLGLLSSSVIFIPIVPFHTWFVDAVEEAPAPVSVILAALVTKVGLYGLLRFNAPIFPDATGHFAWLLAFMGILNILYSTFCAMAQKNLKRLFAYLSMASIGFCLLGIATFTAEGMTGAVFHILNHTIVFTLVFLIVGALFHRAHQLEIQSFGGLGSLIPRYALLASLSFFAVMGLPGLSPFISEVTVLLGAFQTWRLFSITSLLGMVFIAAALLRAYQQIFFGKTNDLCRGWPDISQGEMMTLCPLLLIVILCGIYPQLGIDVIQTTILNLNQAMLPFVSYSFMNF
ncbi:MAG: hypothetical protein A3I75_00085 [Deltaproteobacteria bacterium RIFCSPLOWO2_02_FULL_50_16]|nr:MAG: hypothetical protein A3I75_00085 [Deltaproteobacteria bacterium RIFCSPLOWO2_02_FULL_50_16]